MGVTVCILAGYLLSLSLAMHNVVSYIILDKRYTNVKLVIFYIVVPVLIVTACARLVIVMFVAESHGM